MELNRLKAYLCRTLDIPNSGLRVTVVENKSVVLYDIPCWHSGMSNSIFYSFPNFSYEVFPSETSASGIAIKFTPRWTRSNLPLAIVLLTLLTLFLLWRIYYTLSHTEWQIPFLPDFEKSISQIELDEDLKSRSDEV